QTKDFSRDIFTIDASASYGSHEIKFGGEYWREAGEVGKRVSGGQQVHVAPNAVTPSLPIYIHSFWTTPTATLPSPPVSQLNASPEHKDTALFVQDRWAIRSDLTLSFGLRWDRQQIIDASGTTQIDLKKDFAPRLGIT